MIQNTFPFNRRQRISAVRHFPPGCGTQFSYKNQGNGSVCDEDGCVGVADQNHCRSKEDESIDLLMKKAGFNVATNVRIRMVVSAKRTFPPSRDSKVKQSEETIAAPHSKRRRHLESYGNNSQRKPKKMKNVDGAILATQPRNKTREVLTPHEKVLKALRLFKMVFGELDGDKAALRKTGASRIHYETRIVLMETNQQVNGEKMIGAVPGIKVGDEFQYKAELNVIGLHFGIMGGIDYMNRGDLTLATSIVASEGYSYKDTFEADVVIYSGEGGNQKDHNKNQNMLEDQKLVKGNLVLINSLKRLDQKGKHYVYDGLYLVNNYWRERPQGNILFKFKLSRIPSQRHVDWKKYIGR